MRYILSSFIFISILLCVGCSDKKPVEEKLSEVKIIKPVVKIQNDFIITDIDNRSTTITLIDKKIKVKKVSQPIIAINIFANWSSPSRGLLPYLSDLQQKYPKDLFMISILANSDMNSTQLRDFMKQHGASHFISNSKDSDKLSLRLVSMLEIGENYPIPLTIIFKNGEYNMHFIGATPIEMITSDIEQLRRK